MSDIIKNSVLEKPNRVVQDLVGSRLLVQDSRRSGFFTFMGRREGLIAESRRNCR